MKIFKAKGKKLTCRNCIEIAPRALLLAVSAILAVVLVSLMLVQFKQAREMSNISSDMMTQRTEEAKYQRITEYDGTVVSGADMVSFCRRNLEYGQDIMQDIGITLKGPSGNSVTYRTYEEVKKLSDRESGEYVDPVSKWKCNITKNKNGVITGIVFIKNNQIGS